MSETDLDKIQELLDKLTVEEQFALVENLLHRLRPFVQQSGDRKSQDLYGIWEKHFPQNIDLDATLREIREEWENGFPQICRIARVRRINC